MKKVFIFPLLLCLFLTACKDEEEPEPKTRIIVEVMKKVSTSSGGISTQPANAIIHLWPADDEEYDVEASGTDMYIGYAYDKNSEEYKTAKYGAVGNIMNEPIEPGRYLVYVLLMKSSASGSLAYSYSYIEVKEGTELVLKKTFSHDVPSEAFEEWNKNQ